VFVPPSQPQYVRQTADLALEQLNKTALSEVFLPENFKKYFKQRFWQLGENTLDEKEILNLFSGNLDFYFRTAAERFHLIDDDWQLPLIVPFGESHELADRLIQEPWNCRKMFRKLQRFTISIPNKLHKVLIDQSYARELLKYPGTCILDTSTFYDDRFGFIQPDELDSFDPQEIII
jgi:CRISPR-associated endonuclease/helicase Cas3